MLPAKPALILQTPHQCQLACALHDLLGGLAGVGANCTLCPRGKYSKGPLATCARLSSRCVFAFAALNVHAGRYGGVVGLTSPLCSGACPPSSFCPPGTVHPLICPVLSCKYLAPPNCSCMPGYTSLNCDPCSSGTYKAVNGSSACLRFQHNRNGQRVSVSACLRCWFPRSIRRRVFDLRRCKLLKHWRYPVLSMSSWSLRLNCSRDFGCMHSAMPCQQLVPSWLGQSSAVSFTLLGRPAGSTAHSNARALLAAQTQTAHRVQLAGSKPRQGKAHALSAQLIRTRAQPPAHPQVLLLQRWLCWPQWCCWSATVLAIPVSRWSLRFIDWLDIGAACTAPCSANS